MSEKKLTIIDIKARKGGEPIVCLTAYTAPFAKILDNYADLLLVGDSLGMVIQGHDTTVPVTVDDVVYHTRAVSRGLHRPFLVADLPFMSYSSPEVALSNSVRRFIVAAQASPAVSKM